LVCPSFDHRFPDVVVSELFEGFLIGYEAVDPSAATVS
jgi:hypothetical protein